MLKAVIGRTMEAHMQDARLRHSFTRFALFALFTFASLTSLNRARAQSATMIAATSSPHGVAVTIACHAERTGEARLNVEVLDPQDLVVGKSQKSVRLAAGDSKFEQNIATDKPVALEDLVWYRLRYRLNYAADARPVCQGIDSISQILRRPTVHILAQKSYLSGSDAAIRVIVRDSQDAQPIPGRSSIRIELLTDKKIPQPLFAGPLNRRGTTDAHFKFPSNLVGSYQLHYIAETSMGSAEYSQTVQLEDKVSILLTTEKPIYQPGQAIHVRALALNRADRHAVADRGLTFELEDSHGNKVFKKVTQTDKFGIASADFELADEVNLGVYHLRSLLANENSAPTNTAEIALNVERYVLPKFKTVINFADKGGKPQHDYRPGDHVVGTIHANYFFGKPVDGAIVEVKASSADVTINEAAKQSGKTDKDGVSHFDLKLPDYFAGLPLTSGAARVLIEATVKDSTNHSETRGEPITVSGSPLLITAIPEGGSLIPHLDNQVFILTSYPDGTPAETDLVIHASGMAEQHLSTDSGGIAVAHIKAPTKDGSLKIDADDHRGASTSSDVPLQLRDGTDQILLRPNRAIFHAGDPIQLKVFSTQSRGTAYVDIVKDGQTIVTRDLDIENGEAQLTLAATPAMAGTLDINAYLFGRDAQPIGDHRLVFVQPAEELKIETTTDAAEYKPGGDARVHFHVTNSQGHGVSAALGLQVVDEAVFALAEKQPGFAKVFFYLEQEVMKPRFEIHSLSMNQVVDNDPAPRLLPVAIAQQDQQARALFAATEIVNPNKIEAEFGSTIPQDKLAENMQLYQQTFAKYVQDLAARLNEEYARNPNAGDLLPVLAKMTEPDGSKLHDSWGSDLDAVALYRGQLYMVRSAGPDRRFGTADDMSVYLQLSKGSEVKSAPLALDLTIEHDRGAFNGRATITGLVQDSTGAPISGAKYQLTQLSGKQISTFLTDATGRLELSALPRGSYKIEISAPGFENVSQKFTLNPRDRAVIMATLKVGAATQTVAVGPQMKVEMSMSPGIAPRGFVNAAAGAVFGVANGNGAGAGIGAGIGGNVGGGRFRATQAVEVGGAMPLLRAEDTQISTTFSTEQRASAAHIRSYFPEALYINPEILTDGNGAATLTIPLADSITTWRMAMLASTESGALGTSVSSLKVFQDFFVDLDLPVTLTQGDRVSIPVAIYNYRSRRGAVDVKLQPDDWFSLGNDMAERNIPVDGGQVGGTQFTIEATRIGKIKLTLSATMDGSERSDVVVREIEVVPNGREQNVVFNGRLEKTVQHALTFPAASIPDASTIFVRLYPGPLSQLIEGMDSVLHMPGGCFEQTSSSTYPNVLALDYMKRTKKLTPEVHAKAEGYIANGYQRLLTFEVPGGGFSWFGQAPANKILTAYGLMEFSDMSKVYDVDPNVIGRTQGWLARQQQPDGSWKPDTYFINEGATNRFNSDTLRITAYVAWALEDTGYRGPAVEKAKQFIESHLSADADNYTLAVVANFAVDFGKDRDFTAHAMQLLLSTHTEKNEQAWWTDQQTAMYGTGSSATTETTALAVQALLKWGQASTVARKAMTYIASKKDASGNWGTTQATIMALRALLLASQIGSDVSGTVQVLLNNKPVEHLTLNPDNNDLLHQFVLKGIDASQTNNVELRFDGNGGLAYQVVGRYFVPWTATAAQEALSINVSYDRTQLVRNDIATETVAIHNNLGATANMVMVDIGIPPGFDLLTEDLQNFQQEAAARKSGRLEKFSLTATQAILYFNALGPQETVTMHCRLRAKYPIRAKTIQSRVYEYYDPEVSATANPVQMVVTDH